MSEEKRGRYYSFYTQLIANRMAQHSKMRRLKSSVGQELINSMAVNFEDISNTMDLSIRNLFLDIANLDTPDVIYYSLLESSWKLQHPIFNKNILRNSSFELHTNERILPDWWTCNPSSADISYTDGVVGNNALRVVAGTNETVLLTQTLEDTTITAGQSVTLSCWYRIDKQLTGTVLVPADYFGLHIIGTKRDGTQESYITNFSTDTAGKWRRVSFTYTPTRDIIKIDVTVSVLNSPTFNWLDPVDVDCFQLERSPSPTSWSSNIFEQPFYMDIPEEFQSPVVFEHGVRPQYAYTLNDFWYESKPTRIELEKSTYTSYGNPKTKVLGGLEVDFWNNRIPYSFHVHGSQIRKMGSSAWGNDILLTMT